MLYIKRFHFFFCPSRCFPYTVIYYRQRALERERAREREREREREGGWRKNETKRETDRQINIEIDSKRDRERDKAFSFLAGSTCDLTWFCYLIKFKTFPPGQYY